MTFIEKMKMQAKQDIKTIVLPESEDIRTLEATEIVLKEGFANIILIGNPQEINELAEKNNINLNGAQIVNPATSADFSKYANDLYELRKNKGMTIEQAKEIIKTFIEMIKRETPDEEQLKKLEDAIAFRNVSNMPARVKCALLAWHTLEDMLNKEVKTGSGNIDCCQSNKKI